MPQVPKGQRNPPSTSNECKCSLNQVLPPCRYSLSLRWMAVGPPCAAPPQDKTHGSRGHPGKEQEEEELVKFSPRLLQSDHGFHMLSRLWSAQNCDPLEPKWPTKGHPNQLIVSHVPST